ncbi:hypothetical protein TCE0_060f19346 [Talaromyces pinophilus]|uniref:Uncharacterized protein n=1 Tax=Talaromyces pinophilus TaxID=128442 RepID=A0A6V8HTU4_TALPI|nr:hypothetical protein TCE0_060f19346 [Talaromyces pinophilus]
MGTLSPDFGGYHIDVAGRRKYNITVDLVVSQPWNLVEAEKIPPTGATRHRTSKRYSQNGVRMFPEPVLMDNARTCPIASGTVPAIFRHVPQPPCIVDFMHVATLVQEVIIVHRTEVNWISESEYLTYCG